VLRADSINFEGLWLHEEDLEIELNALLLGVGVPEGNHLGVSQPVRGELHDVFGFFKIG